MPSIAKFYFHDATSPVNGTLPTTVWITAPLTGSATGSDTCRDATDVIGAANPDVESTFTSVANVSAQRWACRRFVTRPLAAQQVTTGLDSFGYRFSRSQSNANHNSNIHIRGYVWTPSTGVQGTVFLNATTTTFTGTTETDTGALTVVAQAPAVTADGDILVFEVSDEFTQGMSTAYTSQFAYDGTTEGSITTAASYVTPPAPLRLAPPMSSVVNFQNPGVLMEGMEQSKRNHLWLPKRLWRPKLWTPGGELCPA